MECYLDDLVMRSETVNDPACPFCPFADPDADFVAEHVHFCHPEESTRIDHASHWELPVAQESRLEDPFDSHTSVPDPAVNAQRLGVSSGDFGEKRSSSTVNGISEEGNAKQNGVSLKLSRGTRLGSSAIKSHPKATQAERTRRLGVYLSLPPPIDLVERRAKFLCTACRIRPPRP